MTHTIHLLGHEFMFASTLLQRQFAGRLVCILIAAPLILLAFAPLMLQVARMW